MVSGATLLVGGAALLVGGAALLVGGAALLVGVVFMVCCLTSGRIWFKPVMQATAPKSGQQLVERNYSRNAERVKGACPSGCWPQSAGPV